MTRVTIRGKVTLRRQITVRRKITVQPRITVHRQIETNKFERIPCRTCNGTGIEQVLDANSPTDRNNHDPCRNCGGTGYLWFDGTRQLSDDELKALS